LTAHIAKKIENIDH